MAGLAPGLAHLRSYRVEWLRRDVVAGLVLTALLVPQGMAYAELAGLPPITGLYTSILCLVGSVFALLSRYAVNFWNQGLHQGASLSLDKEENVSDVFWVPLLVCIAGFVLLFVTMVLLRTRTEIRARRLKALLARERVA